VFYVINSQGGEFELIPVMVNAGFVQMVPDTGTLFYDSTVPDPTIEEKTHYIKENEILIVSGRL
jgi:hypothetical protein